MQPQNSGYVRPTGTLPIPQNAAEYRELLRQVLTCMDNDTRPLVENTVVRSLRDPATAFLLVDIINEASTDDPMSPGIRQLAAVLLRKRVLTLWRGIGLEEQQQLKSILLNQMGTEPVRLVRFAIAHVLCVIARVELRDGWPELMDALYAASQAPSVEHRELACVLVHSLARTIADETGDAGRAAAVRNVQLAGSVLIAGLSDSEGAVRTAALKAADALVPGLAGKGAAKRGIVDELVPRLLDMVRACGGGDGSAASARANDVTRLALRALGILEQLLELHSSKFPHLDAILALLIETARAADAHLRVREEAAEVLTAVVSARPKLLVKKGAVDVLLELGFELVCEGDAVAFEDPGRDDCEVDGDDADDYDFDGGRDADDDPLGSELPRPTSVFGGRLLTSIGDAVASKRVVPYVQAKLGAIQQLADPHARKGALLLAAAVSGGCSGVMRRQADALLDLVKAMLGDANAMVRAAAAQALMHFAANLQPEILLNHEQLIPLIGSLMQDPEESVRTRGARALAGVCEEMPPDQLDQHIATLVPMVAATLNSGTASASTQKYLCEVLAAIGDAKSSSLAPYANDLFHLLIPATGPETATLLRAHALQACGLIAVGAGREVFTEQVFNALWPNVADAFASPHAELREMCYSVAAHMATLLGADFGSHALQVVEAALGLLNDENVNLKSSNPLAKSDFKLGDDADVDDGVHGPDRDADDADGDPDAQDDFVMHVRTADVEEKTAAVYCLGVFAVELGPQFSPHLEGLTNALENCVMHVNSQIRVNALHALAEIVRARHMASYAPEQPPAVVNGVEPSDDTLFPAVRDFVDEFIRAELLPIMNTDTDPHVVAAACDAIVHLTRKLGAVVVHPYLDEILDATSVLLQQQAPCQNAEEDGDFDSDEGEANYQGDAIHGPRGDDGADPNDDHDRVVIDSVSEIVDTLCVAYGPSFAGYFQQLAGYLLPYTGADRSGEDHVFAVGVIAQCLDALGPAKAGAFFDSAFGIATQLVHTTPESVARSNCCLVLNVLVRHAPERFVQQPALVSQVLQIVWAVLQSADELPATHDNAASVVCSMVHTLPDAIPMASVLAELLPRLPMRADRDENVNAARCLAAVVDGPERARALLAANDGRTFEEYRAAVRRTMALSDAQLAPEHKQALWNAVSAAAASVPFSLE